MGSVKKNMPIPVLMATLAEIIITQGTKSQSSGFQIQLHIRITWAFKKLQDGVQEDGGVENIPNSPSSPVVRQQLHVLQLTLQSP